MTNRIKKIIADLEYELDIKIKEKDIFKNAAITEQYVTKLGFKYLYSLDEYDFDFTNVNEEKKILSYIYKIIPMKHSISKESILGVFSFNTPAKILNQFHFNEIVYIDKSLYSDLFDYVMTNFDKYNTNFSISLYKGKIHFGKLLYNTKPISFLQSYYNKDTIVVYFSNFTSYIIYNKNIIPINIALSHFSSDIVKVYEMLKYITLHQTKLVLINATTIDIKKLIAKIEIPDIETKYINFENYKKFYKTLPK